MALQMYAYYPASPGSIRAVAARVRGGSSELVTLTQQVERQHRTAVDLTHGELFGPLSQGFHGPYTLASAVCRRAMWSAVQLEVFADAVEVYNRDSSDPWSIERLNEAINEGLQSSFCVERPGPDAGPAELEDFARAVQAAEAELRSDLDEHFRRLEANLDAAAEEAARGLRSEPSHADIVAAWKAGNLPASADLVWPELALRCVLIDGIDEDLFDLTDQQLVDRLRDPSTRLSDAELEWLTLSYPEAMRRFHEEWTLEGTVLLGPEQPPAGHRAEFAEHGWILGPDGRWYPVQVPQPAALPPGKQVIGATTGGLVSGLGSWVTLDSRQGTIATGEPFIVVPVAGGSPRIYGDPSVGENQTDYLTYDRQGNVYAHHQLPDRPEPWGVPQTLPEPELHNAPPGTWDPTKMANPQLDRLNKWAMRGDVAISMLEGIELNRQLEANRHFAGNITFQVSGDDRRAVIQLAQLQYDAASGEVLDTPGRTYGVVNDEGQVDQYTQKRD